MTQGDTGDTPSSAGQSLPSPVGFYQSLRPATAPGNMSVSSTVSAPPMVASTGGSIGTPGNVDLYRPDEPIMGVMIQVGEHSWKVLCGGRPSFGWTETVDENGAYMPTKESSVYQLRFPNSSSSQKDFAFRKVGITDKLVKGKGDFRLFRREFSAELKKRGLDTIAYCKDPDGKAVMRYIVDDYQMYDRKTAKRATEDQVKLYDTYDEQNNEAGCEMLMNSLDESFRLEIRKDREQNEHFPTLWMRVSLMHASQSYTFYATLKEGVKNRKPKEYPGENMSEMVRDNNRDCEVLEGAGVMEFELLTFLIENYQLATDGDRSYLAPLEALHLKLRAGLVRSNFKDRDVLVTALKAKDLWYTDIGEVVKDLYEDLHGQQKWGPAKNRTDRQAVPSGFGTQQPVANNLTYNGTSNQNGQKKSLVCYNCQQKGHMKRDCPQLKNSNNKNVKSQSGQKGSSTGQSGSGTGGNQSNGKKKLDPRRIAPKEGEPHTRTVKGVKWHWCGKCTRWNKTHLTKDHRTRAEIAESGPAVNFGLPMMDDPAVWCAPVAPGRFRPGVVMPSAPLCPNGYCLYAVRKDLAELLKVPPCDTDAFNMWETGLLLGIVLGMGFLWSLLNAPDIWQFLINVDWPSMFGPGICLACTLLILWLEMSKKREKEADDDPFAHLSGRRCCHMRRYQARQRQKAMKPRWKRSSIKDRKLHKSYPLHRRSASQFFDKAPTTFEQTVLKQLGSLHRSVLNIHKTVAKGGKDPMRPPPRRQGPKTQLKPQWCFKHKARKSRHGTKGLKRNPRAEGLRDDWEQPVKAETAQVQRMYEESIQNPICLDDPDWDLETAFKGTAEVKEMMNNSPWIIKCNHWHPKKKARKAAAPQYGHQAEEGFTYKFPGMILPTAKQAQAMKKLAAGVEMKMVGTELGSKYSAATAHMAMCTEPVRDVKENTFEVICDSGDSVSITNCKSDFIGPIGPAHKWKKLRGLAKGLKIEGEGHVLWKCKAKNGMLRALRVPALYVPDAPQRLLLAHNLLKFYPGETFTLTAEGAELSGCNQDGVEVKPPVFIPLDPKTGLPTATMYQYSETGVVKTRTPHEDPAFEAELELQANNAIAAVHNANINLTEAEKELMKWHYKLGHVSHRKIQFLMRSGILAHTASAKRLHTAAAKLKECPKCPACCFAKQCRRSTPGKKQSTVFDEVGATKKEFHLPGQGVAVDHFVCSTKGRLFTSRGRESEENMYCGGAIFVDMATSYTHIEFQVHLNSHETLEATDLFERMSREVGVIPQMYIGDNGAAFKSKEF